MMGASDGLSLPIPVGRIPKWENGAHWKFKTPELLSILGPLLKRIVDPIFQLHYIQILPSTGNGARAASIYDSTIVHAACDGSVRAITDDIDTTLYIQLVDRTGKRPITCCDAEEETDE